MKKISSPSMFSTMCQPSKGDCVVLDGKNRNEIGLEPKVKIQRHLWCVVMGMEEGMWSGW